MRQAIVLALPDLDDMVGLPDFEWAVRNYLPIVNYTYYRDGAGGEWSYRNNLEPSRYSSLKMEEIAAGAQANQTLFAQLKLSNDDANQKAIPLIILSNHGGRNLDGSPSPPEVALEIYEKDPSIFHEPRF
ncbi:hypothetical protein SCUP515_09708 [Seiridium cupressi]